jgi:uncharacterized iron-regulated membrane protein
MRRVFLWWHRVLGVLASGAIVLFGLTGMVLAIAAPSQDRIAHTVTVDPTLPMLPVGQIARQLTAQHPDRLLRSIDLPATAQEPYHARFKQVKGAKKSAQKSKTSQDVYLNATTGKAIAIADRAIEPTWLKLTKDLHTKLLIDKGGKILVGFGGVMLLVLSVSGMFLWSGWRKLKAGFKIRWQARWQMLNYDLHQVGGMAIVSALILLALTGTALAWDKPLQELGLLQTPGGEKIEIPLEREIEIGDIAFDRAIAAADRVLPDGRVTRIDLPDPQHGYLRIHKRLSGDWLHPHGKSWVDVEPIASEVLGIRDSATLSWMEKLRSAIGPLHTGHFGGLLVRSIYAVCGLGTAAASVTGIMIWWHRTYGMKRKPGKAA